MTVKLFGLKIFFCLVLIFSLKTIGSCKILAEDLNPLLSKKQLTVVNATYMILGLSEISLKSGDETVVGIQVDRGVRDIFWKDSLYDSRVPPDRVPNDSTQLVPYMEGARARELMNWSQAQVVPLTPGIAIQKSNGEYYASDGFGGYPFMVFRDKIAYPTVTFRDNGKDHFAIIPDTHGFNSVVKPALELNQQKKLDLVIACMDSPDKAAAALFLASHGISCYAPCDRFTNVLMGYKERYGTNAVILGSAPIQKTPWGAIIGRQPVIFDLKEPIVAQFTDKLYPDQYCDAPSRYLRELQKVYSVNLNLTEVAANVGETQLLVKEAERIQADVIAARVYNQEDYLPLKIWLESNDKHRLILLHSAVYEFGIKLFREFPSRTTFGDLEPKFL